MPKTWSSKFRVSKIDAAARQLKTAIRLFFARGDEVSIHTLTCASCQVLSDLLLTQGSGGVLRNPHLIKPGMHREWNEAIKRFENFFKHADRDATEELNFNSETTVYFMLEGCLLLETAAQQVYLEARIFLIWMMKAYPNTFTLEAPQQERLQKLDESDFETWAQLLDDKGGELRAAMSNWKPPSPLKTPYDLYLNSRNP